MWTSAASSCVNWPLGPSWLSPTRRYNQAELLDVGYRLTAVSPDAHRLPPGRTRSLGAGPARRGTSPRRDALAVRRETGAEQMPARRHRRLRRLPAHLRLQGHADAGRRRGSAPLRAGLEGACRRPRGRRRRGVHRNGRFAANCSPSTRWRMFWCASPSTRVSACRSSRPWQLGVPVIALATAAIPDTVGDAAILLEDKDPLLVACAVDRLVSDAPLRTELIGAGRARAEYFSLPNTARQLIGHVSGLIGGAGGV